MTCAVNTDTFRFNEIVDQTMFKRKTGQWGERAERSTSDT